MNENSVACIEQYAKSVWRQYRIELREVPRPRIRIVRPNWWECYGYVGYRRLSQCSVSAVGAYTKWHSAAVTEHRRQEQELEHAMRFGLAS